MAKNRVVTTSEDKKDIVLNEFLPKINVTLKRGETIEYGQALYLETSTGKYRKYEGSGVLPKTIYCGVDTPVTTSSDTEIQVIRSAEVDGNLIKGITKTSYDAIDNLEKYGIYIKF